MDVGVIGSGSIRPDPAYGFLSTPSSSRGTVFLHDVRAEALEAGAARIASHLEKAKRCGPVTMRIGQGSRSSSRRPDVATNARRLS